MRRNIIMSGLVIAMLLLIAYLISVWFLDPYPKVEALPRFLPLPLTALLTETSVSDATISGDTSRQGTTDHHAVLNIASTSLGELIEVPVRLQYESSANGAHLLSMRNVAGGWEVRLLHPAISDLETLPITFLIAAGISEDGDWLTGDDQYRTEDFLANADLLLIGTRQIDAELNYSAHCHSDLEGYLTLLTLDPPTGYFQFSCQLDNANSGQVSGRF